MDLDEALDSLYGADRDSFVQERTRLAKELAANGEKESAAAIKATRKPTLSAWTVNQLVRRQRRDVDLLLDAGHRLREAQASVIRGSERETFENARKIEADTLRRLIREAEKLLLERGNVGSATLSQVAETLRAAAISPTGRELLARGRFVQPLPAEGFDIVSDLTAGAPPSRSIKKRESRNDDIRVAREAVRTAKQNLRTAERDERKARQHADRLTKEAESARREAEQQITLVEAASSELKNAEKELRHLTS